MKTKLYQAKPGIPEQGGGFWVNMDSSKRITEKCSHGVKLIALYYILNLLMSDAQARKFTASYADLAQKTGIKLGAIRRHLSGLEYCGVIIAKELPDRASAAITITGAIKLV
jgi:hypothetical protein